MRRTSIDGDDRPARVAGADWEPLWVVGLALLVTRMVYVALPPLAKSTDWAVYTAVGVATPLLALGLSADRWLVGLTGPLAWARRAVAAGGLVVTAACLLPGAAEPVLLLAMVAYSLSLPGAGHLAGLWCAGLVWIACRTAWPWLPEALRDRPPAMLLRNGSWSVPLGLACQALLAGTRVGPCLAPSSRLGLAGGLGLATVCLTLSADGSLDKLLWAGLVIVALRLQRPHTPQVARPALVMAAGLLVALPAMAASAATWAHPQSCLRLACMLGAGAWAFRQAWGTAPARQAGSPAGGRRFLRHAGPLALILAFSLPRVDLAGPVAAHHWGVYLGPALLVRQGGWLLWDVPSQYGFLSELVIAALPLREVWRSLWLLNTLCVAGCASAFYLSCCALRAGLSQQVLSLALALTAVNGLIWGTAPQLTPSVGPYRFVWVYALLLLLGRESRRAPGTGPSRELRVAGNAVWVVGCLWSIESAVYCSSVWLPAWAVLTCCAGDAQRARNWLRLLPLASLAAALLLIQTIYLCGLGHGPDWRALTDFVMPYAAGIHSIVSDPHGAVWCLVFCFAVLLTALIEHWQRGATRAVLALHVGLCASVWSTATYFFARSLPGVAQVLGQVYALALVLALRAAPSDGGSALRAPSYLPRLALAALATLWLTTALATPETTFGALAHVCDRASGLGGTPVRLATDDENALLQRAGVRRDQPLAYAGPALLGAWRTADGRHLRDDLDHPALLPFTSFTLVAPLAPGRRAVYLARFVERRHTSGWLLVDEDYVDGVLPRGSLAPLLGEHYDLVPQGANDRRTLYWCRWRPLASSAARYERGVTPRAPRKTFVK